MSKSKKEKPIVQAEVEEELARAARDLEGPSTSGSNNSNVKKNDNNNLDMKDFMTEMLRQQAITNNQIRQSLQDSKKSGQAVVAAVQGLNQPSSAPISMLPNVSPPRDSDDTSSDEDEENDFEGWDIPAAQAPSLDPPAAAVDAPSDPAPSVPMDDALFQGYTLAPNWDLASQVTSWLASVNSKEVPAQVSKEIDQTYIPPVEHQPLFAPPQLPKAIHDKLQAAPKYISKVPKLVNEHLLKAQKELIIAQKPLAELLSFYYTEQFATIKDIIPEIAEILNAHKALLSQGIALTVSASLKISKARKDNLRPIFKLHSVLRQDPTSTQVLGTDDLAGLAEKSTKEQKALNSCFRPVWGSRAKYKYGRGSSSSRLLRGSRVLRT